ncbi:MAG: spermidine/putrescine ABC transporter permease PotC [Gammaproteobacteria bacterium CG11_big_fil_rev_8_21_14_0_20_46_22]|nr:MAG: spermidine/putrescine ABC transporter permease PotC [Gammaproteobacteria bacterium CG12_big_fil_rev_8_21_14_0_65_46_12]PIR10155.1 MAG: spermidine/putrescine ABC transporter permease PotC [Gammaproteobacteria bacterium CG11_big_fil_rev_8_21_14_0_20_46_22]
MKRLWQPAYMSLVFAFLYLPIIVLVVFSFNHTTYSGLWHGFTWTWYKELFQDTDLQTIAYHSLLISTFASTVAVCIGALGAVAVFKYRFIGRQGLHALIMAMIIVPDLIIGIALLLLYHFFDLTLGFFSLLIAHITFCLPFVFVVVYGRIITLDKNLFEAARDLGAEDITIFKKIMLPLLMPAIVAAWFLSFTMSFDDVVISFFVSGPSYQILPLYIFSQVKLGVTPEINALCSMILLITCIAALAGQWFLRKKP